MVGGKKQKVDRRGGCVNRILRLGVKADKDEGSNVIIFFVKKRKIV